MSADATLLCLASITRPRRRRIVVTLDDEDAAGSSSLNRRRASTLVGGVASGAALPSVGLDGGSSRWPQSCPGAGAAACGSSGGFTVVNCEGGIVSHDASAAAPSAAAAIRRLRWSEHF